jgi:uncharacterized SAM-binding protein YcdF (DUF218 family)
MFKKILSALVLPPAGPLLLSALGLLLMRRWPRFGKTLAWSGVILLWLLATPIVAMGLLALTEDVPPFAFAQANQAQAIVVLGGGNYSNAPEYGGDTVGDFGLVRIRYAARLHRQSGLPILVTGGAPLGGRPEGETMRESLEQDFGVKVRWVEAQSLDTAQNASLSAPILKKAGIKRILLVSHAMHLKRAGELFEREGLEVVPAPTYYFSRGEFSFFQLLPSTGALRNSYFALHEALGIVVQRMTRAAQ